MGWKAVLALLAVAAVLAAGCTSAPAENRKNLTADGTATPIQPPLKKYIQPEPPLPLEKKNGTLVAVPEEKPDTMLFKDGEFGITFTRPQGTEMLGSDCKYWGGQPDCHAMVYYQDKKRKLLEYGATPVALGKGLRGYLEEKGLLKRTQGTVWYNASFGDIGAIEKDESTNSSFSKTLYFGIAGNLLTITVAGNGNDYADAKSVYESVRVGGRKLAQYYPTEFECGFDRDCLSGEKCVSRTICTMLNPEDTALIDYFDSDVACISGGADVCRRLCSKDSDCLRGQRCFEVKRVSGGDVKEWKECD